jgi:hypothetical protein
MFVSGVDDLKALPPVEFIRALFEADYPRHKTCASSRIKSFELFLVKDVFDVVELYGAANSTAAAEYVDWMTAEIESSSGELDLRSLVPDGILLGLCGVISFCDACGMPADALWRHVIAVACVTEPDQPLLACFKLIQSKFEFDGNIGDSYLYMTILKHRQGQKIDTLSPFGPRNVPLIIFMRDNGIDAFEDIVSDQNLFHPLQMHPERHLPMLLFALLEPGQNYIEECDNRHRVVFLQMMSNLFLQHQDALQRMAVSYEPAEDVVSFLAGLDRDDIAPELHQYVFLLQP